MRMIYTLILVTGASVVAQSQRVSSKLYFRSGCLNNTVEIDKASGKDGFTDSTRWYVKTGVSTYKAVSSYGSSAANNAIRETDTLVIEGEEMVIEHGKTIVLPGNVRFIILGDPKIGSVSMTIGDGATLKMNHPLSAMSITAKGILKMGSGAIAPTQLVMLSTVKALNTGAAPIQTTGEAINGATIGASAFSAQVNSVATPTLNFGGFSQQGTLPLVLVSFDAVKQSSGVSLKWTTQQESNLQEFVVEKSLDGKNYHLTAEIPASGNSTSPLTYAYSDATPFNGIAYYRVRMIDLDGKQGLTPVKAVRSIYTSAKVGVYPNPATTYANIVVNSDIKTPVLVSVFNQQGSMVFSTPQIQGTNALSLDLSRYSAGHYLVEVKFSDGTHQTERLAVNRK